MFVDTDGAVPTLVSRLRVDVYTADGSRWYASRDTSHASPADWPVSFALSRGDPQEPRQALVRLRAYAEGAVRDANDKFERRFRYMEAYAVASGRQLNDMTLDELEDLWQQAKTAA